MALRYDDSTINIVVVIIIIIIIIIILAYNKGRWHYSRWSPNIPPAFFRGHMLLYF